MELGRSEAPGRPYLYGTAFEFLERFGLTSLEELPLLNVDVAGRLTQEDVVTEPGTAAGADSATVDGAIATGDTTSAGSTADVS